MSRADRLATLAAEKFGKLPATDSFNSADSRRRRVEEEPTGASEAIDSEAVAGNLPMDPIEAAAIAADDRPVARLRRRVPSWPRPNDLPIEGDYCNCCAGRLWWREALHPTGWRCGRCFPSDHLAPGLVRAVAT